MELLGLVFCGKIFVECWILCSCWMYVYLRTKSTRTVFAGNWESRFKVN